MELPNLPKGKMTIHYLWSCFLLLVFVAPNVKAQDGLSSVRISYCGSGAAHIFAKETVRKAYARINKQVDFVALPCRRSLIDANSGKFDGELGRIQGIENDFPNLLKISPPLITIEGVVLTKNIQRDVRKWSDLKDLNVAIIRGQIFAEKGTRGMSRIVVGSYKQLTDVLNNGRADVGIGTRKDIEAMFKNLKPAKENLHIIGEPVFQATLHHLVHKKNIELLSKLNPEFKRIWEDKTNRPPFIDPAIAPEIHTSD